MAFAEFGDRLSVEPGPNLSLSLDGPFAGSLSTGDDNLVLKAAERLAAAHGLAATAALRLEKWLPVASGIGGGSSDAAATLKLLAGHWGVPIPAGLAVSLGADVPVCLAQPRAQHMRGIGDDLVPTSVLPAAWVVLINPGVALSTGQVFQALKPCAPGPVPRLPQRFDGFNDLIGWLRSSTNDLQVPAVGLCPAIGEVLAALGNAPFSRMSGSGATCFALVPDRAEAEQLAARVRTGQPDWWVVAASIATG